MNLRAYIALGWTPIFAIESDGTRRVQKVVGWQGGNGSAPATGMYVGSTGFVTNITDGVDIAGGAGGGGVAISGGTSSMSNGTAIFSNANN